MRSSVSRVKQPGQSIALDAIRKIVFWSLLVVGLSLTSPSIADTFLCNGEGACRGDVMNCSGAEDCVLDCDGGRSCSEATLNASPGYALYVDCNGWDGCRDLVIRGESATQVQLRCAVNQGCQDLDLHAPDYGSVSLEHDGSQHVLAWFDLHARQSATVGDIECTADGTCLGLEFWLPETDVTVRCTGDDACKSSTFYLPGDGANLTLVCDRGNPTSCDGVTAKCGNSYSTVDAIGYSVDEGWTWGGACNVAEIFSSGFEADQD